MAHNGLDFENILVTKMKVKRLSSGTWKTYSFLGGNVGNLWLSVFQCDIKNRRMQKSQGKVSQHIALHANSRDSNLLSKVVLAVGLTVCWHPTRKSPWCEPRRYDSLIYLHPQISAAKLPALYAPVKAANLTTSRTKGVKWEVQKKMLICSREMKMRQIIWCCGGRLRFDPVRNLR